MNTRRVIGLGWRHFSLLLYCLGIVAVIRILLTFLTYRQMATHIRLRTDAPGEDRPPYLVSWGVRHAARLVPFAHCLTQSLALQYILARQGTEAVIRVGVAARGAGEVEAHAWVLHDDRVLLGGSEHSLSDYSKLVDLRPTCS